MDVLRPDLIERARKMTRARSNNHSWLLMDDEELLRMDMNMLLSLRICERLIEGQNIMLLCSRL